MGSGAATLELEGTRGPAQEHFSRADGSNPAASVLSSLPGGHRLLLSLWIFYYDNIKK